MRALVADPDPRGRIEAVARIEALGHRATAVETAEALLDAALSGPVGFALVALDLPGALPGLEAAKLFVFATIGRPRTAVVALSGGDLAADLASCREAGLDGCLPRPADPGALDAAIRAAAAPPALGALPPGVAALSAHPRFRRAVPALDLALLRDLEALGGPEFLSELIGEFIRDAEAIRRDLDRLVAGADAPAFRGRVLALRSGAANIGAQGVYELCLSWRQTGRRQLAHLGRERLRALDHELARTRRALGVLRAGLDGRVGAG